MSQDQNETRNHERRPWYAGIFSRSEPEREQPKKPVRAPSGFDLEDHFPQAREEKAIGQLVSKLKLFLDSHVEEYYVIKPHRLRTGGERSIEPLSDSDDEIDGAANSGAARTLITNHGLPFPSSSDPYSTRGRVTTADPRTGLAGQQLQDHQVAPNPMRRSTIFRTIVQLLLSCIDPYGKEMETFLPKEVVLFFSSLPKQDRPEPGKRLHNLISYNLSFEPDLFFAYRLLSCNCTMETNNFVPLGSPSKPKVLVSQVPSRARNQYRPSSRSSE